MDPNIPLQNLGEPWSYLFFLEYLSLALSEALIKLYKSRKSVKELNIWVLEPSVSPGIRRREGGSKNNFPLHLSFFMELHLFCPYCVAHSKREQHSYRGHLILV